VISAKTVRHQDLIPKQGASRLHQNSIEEKQNCGWVLLAFFGGIVMQLSPNAQFIPQLLKVNRVLGPHVRKSEDLRRLKKLIL